MSAVVEYIWQEENIERPAGGNPNSIKFSLIDLCPGDVIGIVCMIPAAGFIPHQVAPVVGVVGAAIIFGVVQTPLDEIVTDMHCIFSVHGGGGLVDTVLIGFFARGQVSALDGVSSVDRNRGGWDGRWIQAGFVHPFDICLINC